MSKGCLEEIFDLASVREAEKILVIENSDRYIFIFLVIVFINIFYLLLYGGINLNFKKETL